MPIPKGTPALWHFSAADRNVSQVQLSDNALSGGAPAGYIFVTSRPTCCLKRSMRAHGPLIWLPGVAGTAIQCPLYLARYSIRGETEPFAASSVFITSSTGSSMFALSAAHQFGIA